ncbi:hypothetical protein AHiyo4_03460 [Arthrobacter sp. Hiyo4]|nr:hypothetical protein AHiyo4_03460 [Arthrobacter sp. Hiyo4]
MESLKLLFIVLPGLFLPAGLILMGLSLAASFRRKRSMAGWQEASATVTGNLHGTDGPVVYNPASPAESTLPVFAVAKGRLATGLIMVIFGATAITMFASLSW